MDDIVQDQLARATAMEVNDVHCTIEGELPSDLSGCFFRVGGAWYYPPKFADDIPLHTDGFVSKFRIAGGRVSYSGRFIETDRMRANKEAGRSRFGYYRNRATDDDDVAQISASVANTSAFAFAGKLLALKEDGRPYEIDPVTLETRGTFDFGGALDSVTFTAHPKIDGATGELVAFGYQATGPFSRDVFAYIFAPDGTLRHRIAIEVPWDDMIHDMAITRNYILLPLGGYTIDRDRLARGGPLWSWDPRSPARIAVFSRTGDGSDLRWFTGEKKCLLHTFNAFEEGGQILLDAPFYDGNPFPFLPSVDGSPWQPEGGRAVLRRLRLDTSLPGGPWSEEVLFDTVIGDLGDVDPRLMGAKHRYCYGGHEAPAERDEDAAGFHRPPWPVANSYIRFDVEQRRQSMLRMGPRYGLDECVFVPRSVGAAEDDGYLIGVANDYAGGSELIVADAARLEDGPLARARLPMTAGPQIHACWVDEGTMALS